MTPGEGSLREGGIAPEALWETIAAGAGARFTYLILLRHLG